MEITTLYRYTWGGVEKSILVVCSGDTVTCTDSDGDALGTYQLVGSTLTGTGSLSQTRRDAIGALLVAASTPGP